MNTTLTENDFDNAAQSLEVSIAAVKAIAEVESAGSGFTSLGLPKILFERHHFHKFTNGKFDVSNPDISNHTPGGYTKNEWDRLNKAISLSPSAALQSASWGQFQIMGANYKACGFKTVEDFVIAQKTSAALQLQAFVNFIKSNTHLHQALKKQDWKTVAKLYNGPNYAINKYDAKLKHSFDKFNNEKSKDNTVSSKNIAFVQGVLNKLNYNCGLVDGEFGKKTSNAISSFEKDNDMPITGQMSKQLIDLLIIKS